MTTKHMAKNILFRAILVIALAVLSPIKTGTPSFANTGTVTLSANSFDSPPPILREMVFPAGQFNPDQEIASLSKTVHYHNVGWDPAGVRGGSWQDCLGLSRWWDKWWGCESDSSKNRHDAISIKWAGGTPIPEANRLFSSGYFREVIPYKSGTRRDEMSFWITHRLYAPMWYGGFYYNAQNQEIKACAVITRGLDCASFSPLEKPSRWMTGFPLGNSFRFAQQTQGASAFRVFSKLGQSGSDIITPGQASPQILLCDSHVSTVATLALENGAVPAFTINGFAPGSNPSAILYLEHLVTKAINDHPFSCAGPVLQNNGTMIMPPGCGIWDESGGNLSFGTFRRSGSLRQFGSESDLRNLSKYKQNNRAMTFRHGARSIESDTAVLFVTEDAAGEVLPLTIVVPRLQVSGDLSYASHIFVARTDTGQIAKVGVNPGGPTTIVVAPEVVREVAKNGGEIVVRAVAVGDKGNPCSKWSRRKYDSGEVNYDFNVRACFDGSTFNIIENIRQGNTPWFIPVAAVTSYSFHWHYSGDQQGTKDTFLVQDSYYRFVGDVAQASVRLVLIQSRVNMIGEENIEIALQPNLPQVSRNYVRAGGNVWVGTDVRISPWIYARGDAIRVSYVVTHTDPVSGTMVYSGVMKPDAIEIVGTISQRDGIYQRWSGSEKIILNQANNYSYESSLGWVASELLPCYRYDQRKCRPRADRIDGELRITATAVITIPSSEVPGGIPVQLLSTKTIRPYWNVLYFEETR